MSVTKPDPLRPPSSRSPVALDILPARPEASGAPSSRGRRADVAPASYRYRVIVRHRQARVPSPRGHETLDAPLASTEAPSPSRPDVTAVAGEAPAARAYDEAVAGEVLAGRYGLVERLGEGGMGTVWRAVHLDLDIEVAVKLVRQKAGVPDAAQRLLKEARAAARVVHPGAVRVFDFGFTDAGTPFLVMELLHGRSLARLLRDRGPLAPLEAVRLLLPVLGALAAAHREGIVHRDVKPGNIVLVEDGPRTHPKLVDFGIAAVLPSAWSSKLAPQQMLLGSLSYMAPEQARGSGDPDPRTDVWGASTVLYEMVTGARPFGGPDRESVVFDLLHGVPRAHEALDVHPELWAIVQRGLAKDPGARWPTLHALGAALAAWALRNGATSDASGAALTDHWVRPHG